MYVLGLVFNDSVNNGATTTFIYSISKRTFLNFVWTRFKPIRSKASKVMTISIGTIELYHSVSIFYHPNNIWHRVKGILIFYYFFVSPPLLRVFLSNLFSFKFPLLRLHSLFDPLSFANRKINIRNYLILDQYRSIIIK